MPSGTSRPLTFEEHAAHWMNIQQAILQGVIDMAKKYTESPIEAIVALWLFEFCRTSYCPTYLTPRVSPQAKIKQYRVDFLVEFEDKKIVIECDGHEFHEKTKQQAARDKKRDRDLVTAGYTVLRYTGSEICADPVRVIHDIEDILGWAPPNDEDWEEIL